MSHQLKIDLSQVSHHPGIEAMVDYLCAKTGNPDRPFFAIVAAYFMVTLASTMRAKAVLDNDEIPTNLYGVVLGPSGYGKGFSVKTITDKFMGAARKRFTDEVWPKISEATLFQLATDRAIAKDSSQDTELKALTKAFDKLGELMLVFDSGTPEGIRQIHQKLIMGGAGAINYQVDEVGMNLADAVKNLAIYLELYDNGQINGKLIKNSSENTRAPYIPGKVPANFLGFGAPIMLFDGGATEKAFLGLVGTGYGRRSVFAYADPKSGTKTARLSAKEILALRRAPNSDAILTQWSARFADLVCMDKINWRIDVPDDVAEFLIDYEMDCLARANELGGNTEDEVRRSEMQHRHSKALKIAITFAFVDEASTMRLEHVHQAMKLVEESGHAFERILTQDKPHVRVAKFVLSKGTELTDHDIQAALPFYGNQTTRKDYLQMAMGWAFKNDGVIRQYQVEGITVVKGERLVPTDLEQVTFSASKDVAAGYQPLRMPFASLHKVALVGGWNWCNHHFQNGHRESANVIKGVDMLVLDFDTDVSIQVAVGLLKEYRFFLHTTKSHGLPGMGHRFRLVMPLSHRLNLTPEEYKALVRNVLAWLPFTLKDDACTKAAMKWASHPGKHLYNEGVLLDVMPFLSRTTLHEKFMGERKAIKDMGKLEQWFFPKFGQEGSGRNSLMAQLALALCDSLTHTEVETRIKAFNKRIPEPLEEKELNDTVLKTVAKRFGGKAP